MEVFGDYIYITGPMLIGLIALGRVVFHGLARASAKIGEKLNSD